APVDFGLAATLSLLLFIAIAVALLVQAGILRSRSFQVISGRTRPARTIDLRFWRWPAFILCVVIFLLALVVPLGMCVLLSFLHAFGLGITPGNFTLDNYTAVFTSSSNDLAALTRTIWLAFGTASVTALIGLPLAFIIRRTTLPGRRLLSLFTLVTIAVPGIILACGYIFAWNATYLENIGIGGVNGIKFYGTLWILFAAYIGGSLPYATRLGIGALEQVGQNMLDAARVQGARTFQLLARIVAPLLRANLISVWLLVFTGTMFELAASELLYPPGQPTLPVQIVGYFNNFQLGPGMALAMLDVALVTLFLIVLRAIPWLFQRLVKFGARRRMNYVSTDSATH
ncbi:MAG TPA: ABC transporter permease subunit, partial [Ktedonobacteraceae bacterium]|nr:ABC transporter permease subunit [Ktedonobacteraceae bacterium]